MHHHVLTFRGPQHTFQPGQQAIKQQFPVSGNISVAAIKGRLTFKQQLEFTQVIRPERGARGYQV